MVLSCRPHVEPLREREAGFVHVGGNVGGIEKQHIAGLRADSADIAVGQLGLDHMAQLAMPEGKLEIALQCGRPDVDRRFKVRAVERAVTDLGN